MRLAPPHWLSGIVGSVSGGALLDLFGGSMRSGLLIAAIAMATCAAFILVALLAARSLAAFWPLFGAAELALFMVQAPANAVTMWAVPPELRAFALSISGEACATWSAAGRTQRWVRALPTRPPALCARAEVLQHLLGDIPSPPALGATQAALDDWRLSLSLFVLLPVAGVAAFLVGALLAKRAHDYREDETQQQQAAQQHLEPHEASADVERSPRQQQQQLEQQQHQQHTDELQPLTKADGLGAASGKDV